MTSRKKPLITHGPKDLEVLKTELGNNTIVGDNIKFEAKFLNHHFGIILLDVYIRTRIIATGAGDPT
jgi:DNA polymerase-1